MRVLTWLSLVWVVPAFADSALLYLKDKNERTIVADSVVADEAGLGGQGYLFVMSDGRAVWDLNFLAPAGQKMAIQGYADVHSSSRPGVPTPSMGISESGAVLPCKVTSGAFQILELSTSGAKPSHFAVDFVESCQDGSEVSGALRFNSNLPIQKPIRLNAVAISPQKGSILYYKSSPGDYIGLGRTAELAPTEGDFKATSIASGVEVTFEGTVIWDLDFSAPSGQALQVGHYASATRYPFNSGSEAGLSFSGEGRGCNQLTGSFDIYELQYSATDASQIEKIAADFTQFCDGGPPLKGGIRIHSDRPIAP